MNPKTLRTDHIARPLPSDHAPGGWVVVSPDHRYIKLDAVGGWVYAYADGSRDVDALLRGLRAGVAPEADRDLVFEALDRLADAGLLEQRVAPPAGMSRRVLMQRLVGGAALAALTAALGMPRDAAAAEQCGQEKDLIDEIAYLQTLQGEVADLLDAWYDKADADPKTDEYYLKALGAKEAEAKKREREYIYKLEDATEDLADCKLGPSEMQAKKKKEQLAAHFKKRSQEMDYKDKQAQTQYAAQLEKLKADEEKKKQYIDKNQASVQGDENQVEAMTQHVERRYKMLKSRYAEESETKATLRKRHEERHYKHTNSLKERLVDAGERTELFAEAYTLRQSEKAAKSLDQDLVYKLASESKAKAEESAMIQRKQEESAKEQKQKISYDK